jgi:hypothetical protein
MQNIFMKYIIKFGGNKTLGWTQQGKIMKKNAQNVVAIHETKPLLPIIDITMSPKFCPCH